MTVSSDDAAAAAIGIEQILAGKRICICGGSGGVGKTTISAAIAVHMAARGARVAVVTIDPARRLADALGLEQLDNEPRLVDPARFIGHGIEMRGELWAMMLDPKRTFDEVIERLAPDESTRDDILANRIYQELSNAVSGSQEYTAIAKLYELDLEGGFDLLVLDTPPSRNALDFLDAPDRLTRFFEGRALRTLLRPGGVATRIVGAGTSVMFSVLQRVTGVDLLQDLSTFFRSLGGLLDGFKERAEYANRLLTDPATTFVLVTSPEPEPADEVIYFWTKLRDAAMPFGALIVNRAHLAAPGEDADDTAVTATLSPSLGAPLTAKVVAAWNEHRLLVARDTATVTRLRSEMDEPATIIVPALDHDVHDIDSLAEVRGFLGDAAVEPLTAPAAR